MMFWDASALIPLGVAEAHTESLQRLLRGDPRVVVWWGSVVECRSALARLRREGILDDAAERMALQPLERLQGSWTEILPGTDLRAHAIRMLSVHPLRAADSLQLAAALVWAAMMPAGKGFVCLDERLREAAAREGFDVLPRPSSPAAS